MECQDRLESFDLSSCPEALQRLTKQKEDCLRGAGLTKDQRQVNHDLHEAPNQVTHREGKAAWSAGVRPPPPGTEALTLAEVQTLPTALLRCDWEQEQGQLQGQADRPGAHSQGELGGDPSLSLLQDRWAGNSECALIHRLCSHFEANLRALKVLLL